MQINGRNENIVCFHLKSLKSKKKKEAQEMNRLGNESGCDNREPKRDWESAEITKSKSRLVERVMGTNNTCTILHSVRKEDER